MVASRRACLRLEGVTIEDNAQIAHLTLDQAVTASGNARAQALADAAGSGVRITDPTLSGGQFRAVVQRGSAIDVPPAVVDDPGRVLATKSGTVPVSQ